MQARVLGWIVVGSMLSVGSACEVKQTPPPAKTKQPRDKAPAEDAQPAPAAPADPAPSAADGGTADGGAPAEPTPAAAAPDDLGRRFADPPWFRKELFADAKKATPRRSERDAKNLFTSSILFELADGQTVDSCAEKIETTIKPDVTNLQRDTLEDGRVQFKGNTDHYEVTAQCGAPKGAVMAFLSYRWTSDPGPSK